MIHSFLLIGQSNMAGRGNVADAVPVNEEHILTLRNGRWQPMFRPITPDRSFSGVSLAESFAEAYANTFGVDVGLICCADGGTSLAQWQEGSLLYDNAVFNAKLAMRTSTIAGVLWHQGEADCKYTYFDYKPRLIKTLNALKKDLNLYDVPFLLGGLGEYLKDNTQNPFLANYVHVNKQLEEAANEMDMTCFVSAKGLTSKEDYLHFNSKSLHEFGIRYFEAYKKTYNPNKVFLDKPEDVIRSEMEKL